MAETATALTGNHPASVLLSSRMAREKLVGLAELAEMLGVSKHAALRYSQRDDFPEPIAVLRATPVWTRAEVKAWARKTLPLPVGRPRGSGKPKK
jgi:predicted DNA-binding transcriptional regulator AlpA